MDIAAVYLHATMQHQSGANPHRTPSWKAEITADAEEKASDSDESDSEPPPLCGSSDEEEEEEDTDNDGVQHYVDRRTCAENEQTTRKRLTVVSHNTQCTPIWHASRGMGISGDCADNGGLRSFRAMGGLVKRHTPEGC